ncbi:MAG: FG-GAP-like repeat-containing protein [Bacteroidales bacterium]|jgi:hypothetical protein|nr:FG-GAP-like repeat-containing protein [Bacteroidales bacterium]
MKKSLLSVILYLVLYSSIAQTNPITHENRSRAYDNYGNIVLNEHGTKINYTEEELSGFSDNQIENLLVNAKNTMQSNEIIEHCTPDWKHTIIGASPGDRTMAVYDFNGDGIDEIVCAARNTSNYQWSYWYILKYNNSTNNYDILWSSDAYQADINRIKLFDINDDGDKEIFVGFESGDIDVYNSQTKEILSEISVSTTDLNDIEFGDADNDGEDEIIVCDDDHIFLFNKETLEQEASLNYGAFDLKLGNVDNDADIELVTSHGDVLSFDGANIIQEWFFEEISSQYCMLGLSDIDSDGKDEIIRARSWDFVDVFDADLQAVKYELNINGDIDVLYLQDVTGDGIDEIIIGEGQWGEVKCYDANTETLLWSLDNPHHGVAEIRIGNFDNDASLEICWGAGFSSSGEDVLSIADIQQQEIQWRSVHIDGPIYAIELGDIDNDDVKELVAISYESASGYESGIITVFNSETHQVEWQSDGLFLGSVWTGVFDLSLGDVDNDGDIEILVSAGNTYTGKYWIIDGTTKTIENSYLFQDEDLNEFYAGKLYDIDDDNMLEIITANEDNAYIINPLDGSIIWSSTEFPIGYQTPVIRVKNIDSDANPEIVICKANICVYDGITYDDWISTEDYYTSLSLGDVNGDNVSDIVAGTNHGTIEVLDGNTYQLIDSIVIGNESIQGVAIDDLNNDGEIEYIYTIEGRLGIYASEEFQIQTQQFGHMAGKYNSLIIRDVDDDGEKEIFVGTPNGIVQIGNSYFSCLWYSFNPVVNDISCGGENDGMISLDISGGTPPYSINWSNGSNDLIIDNLEIGEYSLTVTGNDGCVISETYNINQAYLETTPIQTIESCNPGNDGEASLEIIHGNPPYDFSWSNSSNEDTLSNLQSGNYSVTVSDAANCIDIQTVFVDKDTLNMYITHSPSLCFNDPSGSAQAYIIEGEEPINYDWGIGQNSQLVTNLGAGNYSLSVVDNNGCSAEFEFEITSPDEIVTTVTTTPDNSETAYGEGSATLNAYGGVTPYSITWNDPFNQSGITAINLLAGEYIATLVDNNNCVVQQNATIQLSSSVSDLSFDDAFSVYPIPTNGNLFIEAKTKFSDNTEAKIYTINGKLILSKNILEIDRFSIDIGNLTSGIYVLNILSGNKSYQKVIEKE